MKSARNIRTFEKEHWIVDIGAAKMADTPDAFDVIVMPNLYGDILSDVAAQIAGSVGLAGSANIGEQCAMFEAIHGSAPRRAEQNLANPSGLLLGARADAGAHRPAGCRGAACTMPGCSTLEDGVHTYDIYQRRHQQTESRHQRICRSRCRACRPEAATAESRFVTRKRRSRRSRTRGGNRSRQKKELVGIDVFFDWTAAQCRRNSARSSRQFNGDGLEAYMVNNRGTKVYPDGFHGNVLHRSLALPLHGRSGQARVSHAADHRPARSRRQGRSRLHQDREPLYTSTVKKDSSPKVE